MSDTDAAHEDEEQPKRFTQNGINRFCTCSLCFHEKPRGVSMAEYSRLNVGLTSRGLQVWCHRHQVNVVHFDFEEATLKGSGKIDDEDKAAFEARMPELVNTVESNRDMVLQAGRAVLQQRLAAVGLRDDPTTAPGPDPATPIATPSARPPGTTYRELLGAYVAELDRYLATGTLPPDWAQALQMIRVAKGEGILQPH